VLLFLTACDVTRDVRERAPHALRGAARFMEGLDLDRPHLHESRTGRTLVAAIGHPETVAQPRRYLVERPGGELRLFDGLPTLADGTLVLDPAELRWSDLRRIEGPGAALRVDLQRDTVEVVTSPLGLLPVFRCDAPSGGMLISNSVLALRLLAGLEEPDPVGVSSLLALGWTVGDRTLTDGIRALPGGSRMVISDAGVKIEQRLGPASLARPDHPPDPVELAELLVERTRALAPFGDAVECPLTGGRDSRLCLALLRAARVPATCYTGVSTGEVDVQVASDLARLWNLPHRLEHHEGLFAAEPDDLARRFVFQNDGLSSFEQVADQSGQLTPPRALGVKVSGLGGEIARAGFAPIMGPAATARPFSDLTALQRRLLSLKARAPKGVVRPEAVSRTRDYLRAFVDARRAEGWPAHATGQAFYAFERIGRWAATGVRRTAPTADIFSPFFSTPFLSAALAHSGPKWITEQLHYRLMTELDTGLRDAPYVDPWPAQKPRLAGVYATAASAKAVAERLRGRDLDGTNDIAADWVARSTDVHVEVVRRARDTQVEELIDTRALERELSGGAPPDSSSLRALSVIWWLYGLETPR
jgi:asparagine synthase (glutamine-hydrolysing)